MGFYTLTPDEIINNFNVEKDNLIDYFKRKSSESYHMYSNLYPSDFVFLMCKYQQSKEEFLEELNTIHNNVMKELKQLFKGEELIYSDSEIVKKILNKKNYNNLKIQSYAAIGSLKRVYKKLVDNISTDLYYSDYFEGILNLYGNILFDAKSLYSNCYRRKQKSSNMEIFPLSKQLIEYNFTYQYPVVESSIFLLRQAIEVKIKNSLNIDSIRYIDKNGISKNEVGISNVINYIEEKIKDKKIAITVDVKILKFINSWLNKYIHTGRFDFGFWYIEWLHYYLNDFFYLNDLFKSYQKGINLEASIFIEQDLFKNINSDIKSYFNNKVKLRTANYNIAIIVEQNIINTILANNKL